MEKMALLAKSFLDFNSARASAKLTRSAHCQILIREISLDEGKTGTIREVTVFARGEAFRSVLGIAIGNSDSIWGKSCGAGVSPAVLRQDTHTKNRRRDAGATKTALG
jgi:hypothetical protein